MGAVAPAPGVRRCGRCGVPRMEDCVSVVRPLGGLFEGGHGGLWCCGLPPWWLLLEATTCRVRMATSLGRKVGRDAMIFGCAPGESLALISVDV